VEPNGPALATLLEKLKANGALSGRPISRVIVTHEAARDGFWLARFLQRRGVEVHVMQASSLPVDRRARRTKTDVIDAEMLLRTLLAWLRGEPRVCSMIPIPSEADEEARRRSVANFHSGRERPGTMSWFTPPAHRIAALDAIYLSCAFGPCGSCA
jgi:transposase